MSQIKSLLTGLPVLSSIHSTQVEAPPTGAGFYIESDYNSQRAGDTPSSWGSTTVTLVSEPSISSGLIANLSIKEGEGGSFGTKGGVITYPERLSQGDELWSRIEVFFPLGFKFAQGGDALKFQRHKTLQADGSNRGYNEWYIKEFQNEFSYYCNYEGSNHNSDPNEKDAIRRFGDYPSEFPQLGVWATYETYIKLDLKNGLSGKGKGTGIRRCWVDGVMLFEDTQFETLKKNTDYMSAWLIFTFWNGGGPQDQDWYIRNHTITSKVPNGVDASGNRFLGL